MLQTQTTQPPVRPCPPPPKKLVLRERYGYMSTALSRAIKRYRRFQLERFNGEWVAMFTEHYGVTKRTKPNHFKSATLYKWACEEFFADKPAPTKIVLILADEMTVQLHKQRGFKVIAIEYDYTNDDQDNQDN